MSIPLKAKVAIRDQWEKEDSPVQKAIKEFHDALGLEVRCQPDWSILIAELDSVYEDKAQLIHVVVSCIQVWFSTASELLDDSAFEDWAEVLLEKLKRTGASSDLSLFVQASESSRASTYWNNGKRGFTLCVPNVQVFQAAGFNGILREQMLSAFEEKKPTKSLPIHSTTGDEWADVSISDMTDKPISRMDETPGIPEVEYLPDFKALPRPETLLLKPPYHMIIWGVGTEKLMIQCSHAPTLNLLCEYFKKWCRTNQRSVNHPPALIIKLNDVTSAFGSYDTLTLESDSRHSGTFTVSPTMVLSIVEGLLGYEMVFGDASSWHYKRTAPFKEA